MLAVFLLAFVALAVMAATRLAAVDALRTRDAVADAQCRQLLLAGLDRLGDRLAADDPSLDLGAPAGLRLEAEPGPLPGALVLTASTGRRTWLADAAWERDASGAWRLTSTTLRLRP